MKPEPVISNVLCLGVWMSVALMVTGSGWCFIAGADSLSVGVLTAGLALLIATPVLRVAASLVLFWLERDRIYMLITAVVLAVLAGSFILGAISG
ncbi:MAG: DUF1634 domain-containing protein [Verrucomicrobiales bacterium]|nr:DUF1634 domain-containing protein [Verrucomicrobiales bacterium]